MNRELFWKDLERVYAEQDNARFDEEKRQRNEEARVKRYLLALFVLGILIAACFAGLGFLHLTPYK